MTSSDKSAAAALSPVLLELGKVVLICQCFEESLCLLLSLMSHEEADAEDGAFEASWDFHSTKPLGQLLVALRKRIDVPPDLDSYLAEGINLRNQVIHGFLTKRAADLADPREHLAIEASLVSIKLEIKKRDMVINKLLDALWAKYGTSNAALKRNADLRWDLLNEPPTGSVQ